MSCIPFFLFNLTNRDIHRDKLWVVMSSLTIIITIHTTLLSLRKRCTHGRKQTPFFCAKVVHVRILKYIKRQALGTHYVITILFFKDRQHIMSYDFTYVHTRLYVSSSCSFIRTGVGIHLFIDKTLASNKRLHGCWLKIYKSAIALLKTILHENSEPGRTYQISFYNRDYQVL